MMNLELHGNKFMQNPGTGGRGKVAPYHTTHYRIPEPLKSSIQKLSEYYRDLVTEYANPYEPELIDKCLKILTDDNKAVAKQDTQLNEAYQLIAELQQQIEIMQNKELRQREILTEAKKLKANAGGAIKLKIDEALNL